jgi:hypothetical protein
MSDTATVPTDEQLKEYAAQLPDLYKDILAAYQYADPNRERGVGVFEGTLRNFLWNELMRSGRDGIDPGQKRRYPFSPALDEFGDEGFSEAVSRLIAEGFIEPRGPNGIGSLIPTEVGERLIEIVSGRPVPRKVFPDLPKPRWR